MAAWRAGVAVGCVAILITFYLPLWINRYNWGGFKYHLSTSETKAVDWRFPLFRLHITVDELRVPLLRWKIPGDFIDWRILLTILGNCEYALFAWSLKFIDHRGHDHTVPVPANVLSAANGAVSPERR